MGYTSRLANEILFTPFDDKSVVIEPISQALTEEEFCNYCYSHPKFEWGEETYKQEEAGTDENDSPTLYEDIKNQMHQQMMAYENFELWLKNFSISKVYTINGNAGTGKSTFINHEKYYDKKTNWVILDIQDACSYVEWISDVRTDIQGFEHANSKVYGSIVVKLRDIIFRGSKKDDDFSVEEAYGKLKKLVENFDIRFANLLPPGKQFINDIKNVLDSSKNIEVKVIEAAEVLRKYANGEVGENGFGIIEGLNLLLLTLRCMSDEDDKPYVIVFDNFERFIAKDELFNKDVDRIRLLLTSYIKNINTSGMCHRNHFKFAMAVRDSTARMCSVRLHASDSEPSNLDLSDWYDASDIIIRKKNWYIKRGIPMKNSDLVEQITRDCRKCRDNTITGLKLLIEPLFNGNKRLIIDFIGSMLELPGNAASIEKYQELWKEDTPKSRFAARSIIRGMLLYSLESLPDKLFEHLHTYSAQSDKNGIGDARKILTILYNNEYSGNKNEMPLTTVLSILFGDSDARKAWETLAGTGKRRMLSEMLFYMNSYNRRENDWIQFIDLQFRDCPDSVTAEDSLQLEQILDAYMERCMIHLMPAGRVYLEYIVVSFEFFLLRYVKGYTPLFALLPSPKDIQACNSIKELPCYYAIERGISYALGCIKVLRAGEDTIKLRTGRFKDGIYHSNRIINHHREYIRAFASYIQEKYCESEAIDDAVRAKYDMLCKEIMGQINRYKMYEQDKDKG